TVGYLPKPRAIEDGDSTALCSNEAFLFEKVQRDCHAGAPHAKHDRKKLVRKWHLIAIQTIMGHEQPTRQTFLDLAAPIGERCLRGLHHERVAISQEMAVQGGAFLH